MAEPITIARPYAEAVFKMARERRSLARWSEMLALIEAIVTDPNIASRIGDPNLDTRVLERASLWILGDRLDGYGRNLVQVLVQNRRLALISHIRALYEELRREEEGLLQAHIISALPIGEEELRPLLGWIEAKYGRRVNAEVEVNRSLIGGVRIVIGDTLIDASVRGKLDAMAAALAA